MRKIKKNKYLKGSLYILIGFFFALITYLDLNKSNKNDLVVQNDKIITNVTASELTSVLNSKSGVILITHDKSDSSRLLNILLDLKVKENFYIYNVKNDELVLELSSDEEEVIVKQKSTKDYETLLEKLGSYTEKYTLEDSGNNIIDTGYKKIYTPMVMFIKNGKIIFSHYIYDSSLEDDDLKEIYSKGINLLVSGKFS